MNLIPSSFIKAFTVTSIVVMAALVFTLIIDETAINQPIHNFTHQLEDPQGDILDDFLDIIAYGSYEQGNIIVLYLEVLGIIVASNETSPYVNLQYSMNLVARYPNTGESAIYNNVFSIYSGTGTEENYRSKVIIQDSRLEFHFSKQNLVSGLYVVGVEALAQGQEEDLTIRARDNPILTKFLGIIG